MIFQEEVSKEALEICTLVHRFELRQQVELMELCFWTTAERREYEWIKRKRSAELLLLHKEKIPVGYSHLAFSRKLICLKWTYMIDEKVWKKSIHLCLHIELRWDPFAKKNSTAEFLYQDFWLFYGETLTFGGQIFVS